MIYTIEQIRESLRGHGVKGQIVFKGLSEDMLKRVEDRINKKIDNLSEDQLVSMFNRSNGLKLKKFSPSKYFIPAENAEYTCQL